MTNWNATIFMQSSLDSIHPTLSHGSTFGSAMSSVAQKGDSMILIAESHLIPRDCCVFASKSMERLLGNHMIPRWKASMLVFSNHGQYFTWILLLFAQAL
jgi:hypothetical protein